MLLLELLGFFLLRTSGASIYLIGGVEGAVPEPYTLEPWTILCILQLKGLMEKHVWAGQCKVLADSLRVSLMACMGRGFQMEVPERLCAFAFSYDALSMHDSPAWCSNRRFSVLWRTALHTFVLVSGL